MLFAPPHAKLAAGQGRTSYYSIRSACAAGRYFCAMDCAPLLAHIRRYVPITEAEEMLVAASVRPLSLPRKAWLLEAGHVCRQESFVVQGLLRTMLTDSQGHERVLFFCLENWWASDLASFLTGLPAGLSIQALEPTRLLQLNRDAFDELNSASIQFERYFRTLFQNAFVAQQKRIVQSLTLSAQERYEAFANDFPALGQRVSLKDIAAYIGITPEFLSLLRRKAAGRLDLPA